MYCVILLYVAGQQIAVMDVQGTGFKEIVRLVGHRKIIVLLMNYIQPKRV